MSGIVGRESQLGAVEEFFSSASHRVLAIVGEPGIGKTTLWREAVTRAHARAATVLIARPTEAEAQLAFAGLADLLAAVPDELFSSLPEPQRAGLEIALLRAASDRPPARRVVGAGLLTLLHALAAESEVVCAIDDLQWLDAPSAAVVEFALRRVREVPVRALVSVRSEEAERSMLTVLGREVPIERIELGALSVGALHRVLIQELGHSFPRPTLVQIERASGGNPLYAIEIARGIDRRGRELGVVGMPVPESLDALVRARVAILPQRARAALLRTAVLARANTSTVDPAALAPAEEAGLVRVGLDGRVEFVHPVFASAVYQGATAARRREAHRAAASVVRDPEEQARHLALAADAPDEQVVRDLELAAGSARRRGAPDTAAELIELALRLVPAEAPARRRLQLELAEHLYLASDFPAARALLEELRLALEPGDLRARALLMLADIDYWGSGESAAAALAGEALADARDPLLQARCHVTVAIYAGTVDLPKAAAAARTALSLLDSIPDADPALVAEALGARIRADLFLGAGFDRETAMLALALEERAPPPVVDSRVAFKLGQWLRYVDDLDGARASLVQAEQQAREEGDGSSLANIFLNRVIVETWAGDLRQAYAFADQMIDAFDQQALPHTGDDLWRAYVHAYAGRIEAVRAAAAEATKGMEPIVKALWSRCLGLAELAVGETDAADQHLSSALEVFDRVDFREPAIWRVDGDAIEAALAAGHAGRAQRLLVRFEERAAQSRIPWSLAVSARCRGLLQASHGDLDEAAATLERALVEHESCPMPFERARTLLVQGQVHRRLKQKRRARESLEQARTLFAALGTEAWPARVEAELRRVVVRSAPGELSATELRIATLAAEGFSNTAIAERVFLSVKTVESNLRRVYRKLGISSRAQLGRALDRRDAESIS